MEGVDHTRLITEVVSHTLSSEQATELNLDHISILIEQAGQEVEIAMNELTGTTDSDDVAQTVECLVRGDFESARDIARPGSLAEHLVLNLGLPDLTDNPASFPPVAMQRALSILSSLGDLLTKLGRNEFEGNLGRWASNLTLSGVRTGLLCAKITVFRQMTGFFLESRMLANATPVQVRSLITILNQSIGSVENILGAIRDEYNGTANMQTRLARAGALFLAAAAFILAATAPQALPVLASFSSQMAFYSYATDLANLFLPTSDNTEANLKGTAASGLLNWFLQYLGFTAMNYLAPQSGPGYAMSQGSEQPSNEAETFTAQLLNGITSYVSSAASSRSAPGTPTPELNLAHDIWRGIINGLADVPGQVLGGELMHAFQAQPTEEGFRLKVSARIPNVEQTLNQLLSTNAIRTSVLESLISFIICSTRYFSTLPISKEAVDHIVNVLASAFFFAGRFSGVYVNERTKTA